MPPPHGFSQASFSSRTIVLSPARARRSAVVDPAGPPPSIATVFIVPDLADCRPAAVWPAYYRPVDVLAGGRLQEDVLEADYWAPRAFRRIRGPANPTVRSQPSGLLWALACRSSPSRLEWKYRLSGEMKRLLLPGRSEKSLSSNRCQVTRGRAPCASTDNPSNPRELYPGFQGCSG